MKALASGWVLALLAIVANIGTTAGLLYLQRETITGRSEPAGSPLIAAKTAKPRFWSFNPDEIDSLIAELKTERGKLVERQTELDKVAAHLDAEKQELEKTRADVAAMRDAIAAEIPQIQDSEKKNLKTLAQTYSTMTPGAVVSIFHDMDEMMCVKLLSMMKPQIVGAILQEMSQQDKDDSMNKRAARISDKLRLMIASAKPAA